jgi:hypothetical protein
MAGLDVGDEVALTMSIAGRPAHSQRKVAAVGGDHEELRH